MAGNTKKVGGNTGKTETTSTDAPKNKPKGRPAYTPAEGETNDKGLLILIPSTFDHQKMKPLAKKAFADEATFMDYRASAVRFRAERMLKAADILSQRASKIREFGDPIKRKKALRADKLKKQLAALEKELAADGENETAE